MFAETIEKKLRNLSGIEKATVNNATEKAYIEYDAYHTELTQIENAIKKAGYTPGSIQGNGISPDNGSTTADGEPVDENQLARDKEYKTLLRKFIFSTMIAVPFLIFSYPDLLGIQQGTDLL